MFHDGFIPELGRKRAPCNDSGGNLDVVGIT